MLQHWVSDSEDSDKFEWDTDGEDAGSFNAAASGSSALASRNFDAPGPSTKVRQSADPSSHHLVVLQLILLNSCETGLPIGPSWLGGGGWYTNHEQNQDHG